MKPWGASSEQTDRGVTPVLGIVLLLGIVAIGSMSILMFAGAAMDNFQTQSEIDRVQQAYVELGQTMSAVALDSDTGSTIDLDIGQDGAVVKRNSATITVTGESLGQVHLEEEITFGTVEYTHENGQQIAFEGGAVFYETGQDTRVISAPAIHYDAATNTFNFPIVDIAEEATLSSGTYEVQFHNRTTYPHMSVLQDEQVTVEVQSDYYVGWKNYFEAAAGSGAIKAVDHDARTVTVELGYGDLSTVFENDVTYAGEPGGGHFDNTFDNAHQRHMPQLDSAIESHLEDIAEDHDQDISAPGTYTLTEGEYYASEITADHDISVEGDGNVTLAVEGDVTIADGNAIRVDDSGSAVLQIYTGGDKFTLNGEVCVGVCPETGDDANAARIQFYGTSDLGIDLGPGGGANPVFEGILYAMSNVEKDWGIHAPQCDGEQLIYQAQDAHIFGSVAVYSVCAHSSGHDFDHDPNLIDTEIDIYPAGFNPPPDLTYLNIAYHELYIVE